MTASAHTPGPWYATEPFAGFASIKQEGTDALIFGIAAGAEDEKQDDEVCEANARLIAAAPDAVDELRELRNDLRILRDHVLAAAKSDPRWEGYERTVDGWVARIDAVLAKAEGAR